MTRASSTTAVAVACFVSTLTSFAAAAPPTKDECVDAHSKGQDLREKGQLVDAKRLFLLCAQSTCPALVQSDCAKFGEELSRTLPSVSFVARDAKGADLFDTQVYLDGALVASRLDDGKAYDVDPGKHTLKFAHGGKDVTMTVVVSVGDKGRAITATFGEPGAAASSSSSASASTPAADAGPSRPVLPLVVAGLGGAALATGVVLTVVGLGKVPSVCSRDTNQCAAPPGSPVFDEASSGMSLANVGIGVGIAGAVVGIGGLVWYFTSAPSAPEKTGKSSFVPWADLRGGAGASYRLGF